MKDTQSDQQVHNDGVDRRSFLTCMAWAGTGLLWTMAGGVPTSKLFAATSEDKGKHAGSAFSFVQISDSHIGFNKPANQDVTGTLRLAIERINTLPTTPDLLLHTGDISHSSKPEEFDTAQQLIKTTRAGETFYVPGSTISPMIMAHCIWNDSAKIRRAGDGTASPTKACTSSV